MADKDDDTQLNPRLASLAVDWRRLEEEVGALGVKLKDLRGKDELVGRTTMSDLEKRYEEISQHLMEVKEKTYDQLLDGETDGGDPNESDVVPGVNDALETAKQQAAQFGQKISRAASSASSTISSRVADLGASTQPHREAASEMITGITERVGATARGVATDLAAKWDALRGEIESAYQQLNSAKDREVSSVNIDAAKSDPEGEFQSPEAIANHVGLTRAEKITSLRSWAFEVQRRLDAASEGMAPTNDGVLSTDAELLRRIELQIEALTEPLTGSDS